jgi:drug/metabolite transporter (DMT)-like permease
MSNKFFIKMKNIFLVLGTILILVGVYQIATNEWASNEYVRGVWGSSFLVGLDVFCIIYYRTQKRKRPAETYSLVLVTVALPFWLYGFFRSSLPAYTSVGSLLIFLGIGLIFGYIFQNYYNKLRIQKQIELEKKGYQGTGEIG